MKKFLSILIVLTMVFGVLGLGAITVSADPLPSLHFVIADRTMTPTTNSFTAQFVVRNVTANGFRGLDGTLTWDTSRVTLTGAEWNSALPSPLVTPTHTWNGASFTAQYGTVTHIIAPETLLFTLTFDVVTPALQLGGDMVFNWTPANPAHHGFGFTLATLEPLIASEWIITWPTVVTAFEVEHDGSPVVTTEPPAAAPTALLVRTGAEPLDATHHLFGEISDAGIPYEDLLEVDADTIDFLVSVLPIDATNGAFNVTLNNNFLAVSPTSVPCNNDDLVAVSATLDFTGGTGLGNISNGATVTTIVTLTAVNNTGHTERFAIDIINTDEVVAGDDFVATTWEMEYVDGEWVRGAEVPGEDDTDPLDILPAGSLRVGRTYEIDIDIPIDGVQWLAIPLMFDNTQIQIDSVVLGPAFGDSRIEPLTISQGATISPFIVGEGENGIVSEDVNEMGRFIMGLQVDSTAMIRYANLSAIAGPFFTIRFTVLDDDPDVLSLVAPTGNPNANPVPPCVLTPIFTGTEVIQVANMIRRGEHAPDQNNNPNLPPLRCSIGNSITPHPIEQEEVIIRIVYNRDEWECNAFEDYDVHGTHVRVYPNRGPIEFRAIVEIADGPNAGTILEEVAVVWSADGNVGGWSIAAPAEINSWTVNGLRGLVEIMAELEGRGYGVAELELVWLEIENPGGLNQPATGVISYTTVELDINEDYVLNVQFEADIDTLADVDADSNVGLVWTLTRNGEDITPDINDFFGGAPVFNADMTFSASRAGTYVLTATSVTHPCIYVYITFEVGGEAYVVIRGRALLGGKERVNSMHGWAVHENFDLGIRVELVEIGGNELTGQDFTHVLTYTNNMPMNSIHTDPASNNFLFNYALTIPAELIERIEEGDGEFVLRFTRHGEDARAVTDAATGALGGPITVRAEQYLVADVALAINGAVDFADSIDVLDIVWLVAGAFVNPGPQKYMITPADVNAIRGQLGRTDDELFTTIWNINEYLNVDGGDFSIVLWNLGRTRTENGTLELSDGTLTP